MTKEIDQLTQLADTALADIAGLTALADKLFAQGNNFLGNQVLEIVYNLEALAQEQETV